MNACGVEIIRDSRSFDALREEWAKLSAPRVLDNPFLSHAWNSVCAARLSPREAVFTLVLRDRGGEALGIAPLAIERAKIGPIRFRRLCFLGEGFSDYHDFVVQGDDPGLHREMWRAIRSTKSEWDLAQFSELPQGSASLCAEARSALPRRSIGRASCSPKLELADSWDGQCRELPPRLVKDYLYQERRLERLGEVRYQEVSSRDEVLPFMAEMFRLHEARWAGTPTPSKFLKPEAKGRATELALAMFDAGHAAYGSLSIDGTAVAVHFGFTSPSTRYYYVPAYDPEYDKYSIGRSLYFRTLRAALASGARRFDFLRGGEEYKFRWGGVEEWNNEVGLSLLTPRSTAARAAIAYRRRRTR